MQLDLNTATLEHLRLVLAHEYFRCDQAFLDFADLATLNIAGQTDKRTLLAIFDAYSRFLHHLYEFYVGNIKRERKSLGAIPHEECDRVIQAEVEKLIQYRRKRIKSGNAPPGENQISYYEKPVPPEFSREFRQTRNRVAHADVRRTGASGATTLHDFYERYHRLVILLYEEPHWLWRIADPSVYDWGEIERFNLAVDSDTRIVSRSLVSRFRDWLFRRRLRAAIRERR